MLDKPDQQRVVGAPPLDFRSIWRGSKPPGCWCGLRGDQQGHRAASAGALAIPGRDRGRRTARVFVHQRGGSEGRRYDVPVAIGALAASARIYAVGMGRPVEEIGDAWLHAITHPIAPSK